LGYWDIGISGLWDIGIFVMVVLLDNANGNLSRTPQIPISHQLQSDIEPEPTSTSSEGCPR